VTATTAVTPATEPLELEARTEAGPDTYAFDTADGVHGSDAFRTADLLVLEALWDRAPDSVLVSQAAYGVVPTVLSAGAERVTATETSVRAATLCSRNAARNGASVSVAVTGDVGRLGRQFDAAAYIPRPYTPIAVGKQRIGDALRAVEPGGRLVVAAAAKEGLSRYRSSLADLASDVETVASREEFEAVAAQRPETVDPPRQVTPTEHTATVDGVTLSLVSVPGLFSASELDHGTRLLLEAATVTEGDRVLDLCCGYGAVGAYAAATADCSVWLTDDDYVATACARRTLEATGVEGTVRAADGVGAVADRTFDRVLSNPPTHAGSGVLADLFSGARRVLAPDGRFTFVHHRTLDLSAHLDRFGSVETVAEGEEHVVRTARP
jgi:23S rRNA (guanine1835-N2)-methyltransferase